MTWGAYTRHSGSCIDHTVVHVAVPSVDVLRRGDPFLLRLVREHGPERHVADALDVRYARVEVVIDHDAPVRVDFDAKTFDVGSTADSDKYIVCFKLRRGMRESSFSRKKRNKTIVVTHRVLLPSLAASVVTITFPFFFSAESTLVLSLNLSLCFVSDFWNCFLSTT